MRLNHGRTVTLERYATEMQRGHRNGAGMLAGTSPARSSRLTLEVRANARIYREGILAGLVGATTIALWFFLLDWLHGRPLHTPSILGNLLFNRGESPAGFGAVPISLGLVALFSCVHGLVFAIIGGLVARLLAATECPPHAVVGVLLLFVALDVAFVVPSMLAAQEVYHAVSWPGVMMGNLLASVALGTYLWRRHPKLVNCNRPDHGEAP